MYRCAYMYMYIYICIDTCVYLEHRCTSFTHTYIHISYMCVCSCMFTCMCISRNDAKNFNLTPKNNNEIYIKENNYKIEELLFVSTSKIIKFMLC